MKAIRLLLLVIALHISGSTSAQKVKLAEGNLGVLKNIAEVNIKYDYNRMAVGKFENESDYIAYKKEQYNKIEAGRGDRWAKLWVEDRKNLFAPEFEKQFTNNSNIALSDGNDQKYTIILKTVFTEPGYNVGIWKKDSEIDAIALIVESAHPDIVIAKILLDNCNGGVYNDNEYDPGMRLKGAYGVAGKSLGKFLRKAVK